MSVIWFEVCLHHIYMASGIGILTVVKNSGLCGVTLCSGSTAKTRDTRPSSRGTADLEQCVLVTGGLSSLSLKAGGK